MCLVLQITTEHALEDFFKCTNNPNKNKVSFFKFNIIRLRYSQIFFMTVVISPKALN